MEPIEHITPVITLTVSNGMKYVDMLEWVKQNIAQAMVVEQDKLFMQATLPANQSGSYTYSDKDIQNWLNTNPRVWVQDPNLLKRWATSREIFEEKVPEEETPEEAYDRAMRGI